MPLRVSSHLETESYSIRAPSFIVYFTFSQRIILVEDICKSHANVSPIPSCFHFFLFNTSHNFTIVCHVLAHERCIAMTTTTTFIMNQLDTNTLAARQPNPWIRTVFPF